MSPVEKDFWDFLSFLATVEEVHQEADKKARKEAKKKEKNKKPIEVVIKTTKKSESTPMGKNESKCTVTKTTVTTPAVESVLFQDPITLVKWTDGTTTRVRCSKNDTYSKDTGLAMCFMKKMLGNQYNYYDEVLKICEEKAIPTKVKTENKSEQTTKN